MREGGEGGGGVVKDREQAEQEKRDTTEDSSSKDSRHLLCAFSPTSASNGTSSSSSSSKKDIVLRDKGSGDPGVAAALQAHTDTMMPEGVGRCGFSFVSMSVCVCAALVWWRREGAAGNGLQAGCR